MKTEAYDAEHEVVEIELDPTTTDILWGSDNSDTRIYWSARQQEVVVYGNMGPMPGGKDVAAAAKLAKNWNLVVIDSGPMQEVV